MHLHECANKNISMENINTNIPFIPNQIHVKNKKRKKVSECAIMIKLWQSRRYQADYHAWMFNSNWKLTQGTIK